MNNTLNVTKAFQTDGELSITVNGEKVKLDGCMSDLEEASDNLTKLAGVLSCTASTSLFAETGKFYSLAKRKAYGSADKPFSVELGVALTYDWIEGHSAAELAHELIKRFNCVKQAAKAVLVDDNYTTSF